MMVPIVNGGPTSEIREADEWVKVESRWSGVPGLIITQAVSQKRPVEGMWVVTQKATGRQLGGYRYESIAAARRAAKRVALEADWTDAELIYEMQKPSTETWRKAIGRLLAEEAFL